MKQEVEKSFYEVSRKTKMANRTVKDAASVKGTNPQYLIEKITRTRIYECKYWKEECFALTGKYYIARLFGLASFYVHKTIRDHKHSNRGGFDGPEESS